MTHPHCQAWNVLIATEAGERVSLAALFANFTRADLAAWYRQSALNVGGQYGIKSQKRSTAMLAFTTERFSVSHIHCERNEERGLMGRDVYIAFDRFDDIPKPLCTVTLWGEWVEWIEVPEEYRRQGIAREIFTALEKHVGPLNASGATDEGEAFCQAVCPEVGG